MKIILTVIFFAVVCAVTGCESNPSEQTSKDVNDEQQIVEYKKITAEEAIDMMGDGDTFILLDVRTEEEFNEEHIEGAVLIPDSEIKERAVDELSDKDSRILIYCRSGRRSVLAAQELIDMGYTNVYDFGGIIDWPNETVSE